jgi:hypothetical protein
MQQNMQEVMDSMIDTEFWYEESGSRADGRGKITGPRKSKKWWLPSPRVPEQGLSQFQRKRLVFQAKLVHQILKAAKSINEQVLSHMPIPAAAMDALPKASIHSNLLVHYSLLAILQQALCSMFAYKTSHRLSVILMQCKYFGPCSLGGLAWVKICIRL